jgi:hypothetical protein
MVPIRTQVYVLDPADPEGPAFVDYSTRTVRIDREHDVQVHLTGASEEGAADVSLFFDRENATALRDALSEALDGWPQ